MLLFVLLCLGVSQGTKFVSYVGQAGPGWGNPGTNEEFLKYIGVPGYGGDFGYNVLNFAFWVSTSTNGGAAVNGAAFDWQTISTRITSSSLRTTLTGSASPTAAALRSAIKTLYKTKNIDICISAFGGTDHPMGNGASAVATGQSLAAYAKQYDYDCVDVDWEEAYYGKFNAGAGGEEWLCTLTDTLYSNLHSDGVYITHAPQAPYFMGSTLSQYPDGGYTTVHKNCGAKISWYNVQFYNQGSTTYADYSGLFEQSIGWSKNSAVYQIMDGASPENVPVPAEKIVVGKHTLGDGSSFVSGSTLQSVFNDALSAGRWDTGFMSWQFYREIASADSERLITGVLGANWTPSAPTPPTTASPTFPPSPSPAPTRNPTRAVTGNIQIVNFGAASGQWYYALNVLGSRYPVSAVQILMANNVWFDCIDAGYAWKCSVSAQISYPLSVRMTAGGDTLTAYGVVTDTAEGAVFDFGANFGDASGGSVATPNPAQIPTAKPTAKPTAGAVATPPPVPSSGSGITVTARSGSGAWWFTCSLSNVPSGISIESVRMKHSGSNRWETGVYKTWSGGYYQFSKNTPFSPPLSFKIKATTGQELTGYNLLDSYSAGSSGTLSGSFSSAFSFEDGDGAESGGASSWTLWFAVAMVVLLVAAAAVFFVIRRRRTSAKMFFEDSKGIQVADDEHLKTEGADSTAVLEADEEQQIVVEVEAHPSTM